jgi:hypothetical protein
MRLTGATAQNSLGARAVDFRIGELISQAAGTWLKPFPRWRKIIFHFVHGQLPGFIHVKFMDLLGLGVRKKHGLQRRRKLNSTIDAGRWADPFASARSNCRIGRTWLRRRSQRDDGPR